MHSGKLSSVSVTCGLLHATRVGFCRTLEACNDILPNGSEATKIVRVKMRLVAAEHRRKRCDRCGLDCSWLATQFLNRAHLQAGPHLAELGSSNISLIQLLIHIVLGTCIRCICNIRQSINTVYIHRIWQKRCICTLSVNKVCLIFTLRLAVKSLNTGFIASQAAMHRHGHERDLYEQDIAAVCEAQEQKNIAQSVQDVAGQCYGDMYDDTCLDN